MLILILILLTVSFLSIFINNNYQVVSSSKIQYNERTKKSKVEKYFLLFIIILILSVFAGLRTNYNDTATYINSFRFGIPDSLTTIKHIDYSLGAYPGFMIYQIFIKSLFGNNPQIFILISSIIYIILFVSFYNKYSYKISLSIYLFITSGIYIFGMAAIKQILAMSIGALAIGYLLENNRLKFIITIFIAATFHPYVLMYLILPFFMKKPWSKQILLLLIIFIGSLFFFEKYLSTLIGFTGYFGKSYELEYFLQASGTNKIRILVLAVTPFLSWIFRKQIHKENNKLLNVSVNASIMNFILIIPGSIGAANTFGRLSFYFLPFSILALTWILYNFKTNNNRSRRNMILLCIIFYFIFFIYENRGFSNEFTHIFSGF